MRKIKKNFDLCVEELDKKKLLIGSGLVVFSFFVPLMINVHTFDIWSTLERSLREGELTQLMVTALQLVSMNALRTIPHYVGAFLSENLSHFGGEARISGGSTPCLSLESCA